MLDASPTALRAFVLVATLRSFSKAARLLGTRQSTVSSQIARLEELVGKPLLERSTRRVSLAPAGKRLLPLAEEIVELHAVAAARVNDSALEGTVRLACPESLWTAFDVADAIGRFTRSHPEVHVDMVLVDPIEAVRRFYAGELELCIAFGASAPDGGRTIRRERLRWYGRATDPQHGLPIALIETPFEAALAAIADALARPTTARFQVAMRGASLATALQAVMRGIGIAALPATLADAAGLPVWQGELPALSAIDVALLAREQPGDAGVALRTQLLAQFARGARAGADSYLPQRASSAKRAR